MKTCEDVLDLLPDALPWIRGEALEVHDHLKVCPDCADTVESMAQTIDVLQNQAEAPPELSASFADDVLAALPATPGASAPLSASPFAQWGLRAAAAVLLFAAGAVTAGATQESTSPDTVIAENHTGGSEPAAIPTEAAPSDGLQPVAVTDPQADPLGHYVSEASLVLQAVETLDTNDPDVVRLLAFHVKRTELLENGDRLLVAMTTSDPERAAELRPLISGTQLILRKVRHARPEQSPQSLWTLRNEVRETGILDAYRQLLAHDTQPSTSDPL